ncbi:hypothetical protein SAMN05443633_101308 [Chryseobacterium arachidis]|uniref:Uncharacterized protein n=1 Tax=Chryseobacterium arachidis TaxID=1416778 RepID=A0A1M4TRX4_9FLAO|nr:hypothetical protein [Chryseobacterium arachidis]SHE47166.1 hypothetical protein SAMN05443633_101308 [Chryseobacterium arachidis]
MDCETTYQDYYFNNWSLRNWVIKPQPTTEFSRQFAKKEVGQCLYEKYFISLDPRYRTELLKLFKDNHEIKISVKNFEINTEFKEKTGRNTPSNPVYFDPNYLE